MDNFRGLHFACGYGHKNIVEYLVEEAKCDLEAKNSDDITPLHIACEEGYLEIVEYLISKGSSIVARDRFGFTVLHLACKSGNLDLVKYLIEEQKCDFLQKDYNEVISPYDFAKQEGHQEIVKYLDSLQNLKSK